MSKHEYSNLRVPIELDNPSIYRDPQKCILCGACKSVCKYGLAVYENYTLDETQDEAICVHCGQCTLVCPTNSLQEVNDIEKVRESLKNPEKIVVFQTAPAVRVALGEEFGMEIGTFVEGKLVSALRALGASYVVDTTFGADLTIMEEANELIKRMEEGNNLPQFTSCCPAWVKFVETFLPEYISSLSTTRSPILMQGPIIKTFFAKENNINPENIISVAITPCTAKKYEITKGEMNAVSTYYENHEMKDIDYVLTTRELARFIKEEHIDWDTLPESDYDSILGKGSGAGLIFGSSGGVMEAALRTAYHTLTGNHPNNELLQFSPVRGLDNVKEATLTVGDKTVKVAVINGTFHAKKFLTNMKGQENHYDFIEVMACPGGCMAGGGQPKTEVPITRELKEKRMYSLYQKEETLSIRNSYQNPDILKIYSEFLQEPGSKLAHLLLHTTHHSRAINVRNSDKKCKETQI